MYVIRRVHAGDLAALIPLCQEHARYEGAHYHENGQIEHLRSAFFSHPPLLFGWVVEHEGGIVGYMTATRDFSTWTGRPFIHMDCLFLSEAHRRKRLGARLMAQLVEFSREHDCDLIQWQTPSTNHSAAAFYRRMGASSTSKLRFYLPVGE